MSHHQQLLEIKKMKQGMSYSCKEKTIILNVFKYFRTQFADTCVTEIVRRTAKATGCSEKSIFQFRKEEASVDGLRVPSTTKVRKNININSRDIKYDGTVRQAIRDIIYDLKYKNIVPSLNTILKQTNNNTQIPKFSLMTLRRLMCDMGFGYEKNGSKSVLVEKTAPMIKENLLGEQRHQSASKRTAANRKKTTKDQHNIASPPQQQQQHQINGQQQQHRHYIDVMPPPPPPPDLMLDHQHSSIGGEIRFKRELGPPPANLPMHFKCETAPSLISGMDMHFKREPVPPWMQQPPHHGMMMMMKQQ